MVCKKTQQCFSFIFLKEEEENVPRKDISFKVKCILDKRSARLILVWMSTQFHTGVL